MAVTLETFEGVLVDFGRLETFLLWSLCCGRTVVPRYRHCVCTPRLSGGKRSVRYHTPRRIGEMCRDDARDGWLADPVKTRHVCRRLAARDDAFGDLAALWGHRASSAAGRSALPPWLTRGRRASAEVLQRRTDLRAAPPRPARRSCSHGSVARRRKGSPSGGRVSARSSPCAWIAALMSTTDACLSFRSIPACRGLASPSGVRMARRRRYAMSH